MRKLTTESAVRLQKILTKRIGHELSQEELEQAYDALIEFAFALVDLDNTDLQGFQQPEPSASLPPKLPIANYNFGTV